MERNLNFDVDVRVNAFECNIRALGGLLSAHVIAGGDIGMLEAVRGMKGRGAFGTKGGGRLSSSSSSSSSRGGSPFDGVEWSSFALSSPPPPRRVFEAEARGVLFCGARFAAAAAAAATSASSSFVRRIRDPDPLAAATVRASSSAIGESW